MIKKLKYDISGYLFLLPAMLLFGTFMFLPIIKGLILSFQHWSISGVEWAGVENYLTVFQDNNFWKSLVITVEFTFVIVFVGIILSLIVAFIIDEQSIKFQSFFRAAFYFPCIAPTVVISITWKWLYNPAYGLFNQILEGVGLKPVMWLGDPQIALLSIMIMILTMGQGANILILSAALGGIPKELFESAKIDGASKIKEILAIKLPLLKPSLLYLVIVNTVGSFQVFAPIYLLTSGGPNGSTTTLGYLIYESAFKKFSFSLASTQAVVLLIIVITIAVFQYKKMSSDIEY